MPAPTAINPATSQSALLKSEYADHERSPWETQARTANAAGDSRSSFVSESTSFLSKPYANASPRHNQTTDRSPPRGNSGRPPLPTMSPLGTVTSVQRGPSGAQHDDQRLLSTHLNDQPLTLHIPKTQDLPRIADAFALGTSDGQPHERRVHPPSLQRQLQGTSLPSFASFKEHTTSYSDKSDIERAGVGAMSTSLPCYTCTKLSPLVTEMAGTMIGLDDIVQSLCHKNTNGPVEHTTDDPVHTAQWILERLRLAQRDLQDMMRRAGLGYAYQQPTPLTGGQSRPCSPSNPMKRQASWDRDEALIPKRPRSGECAGQPLRAAFVPARRPSIDPTASRINCSPRIINPVPAPAAAQPGSPIHSGRPLQPLPSPSSIAAYPPKTVPTDTSVLQQPARSPATSYQPSGPVHNASASSASSAHMADLQQQMTLKTLALQTLQGEYASLLQKLQRERLKSQTIEKKTSVADQEMSELVGKNEDLLDANKTLEARLEECEKKREAERLDAVREKEQWGRMLDMSGRLQAKQAEERQKLADERDNLRVRVAAYEEKDTLRGDRLRTTPEPQCNDAVATFEQQGSGRQATSEPDQRAMCDVAGLQREVGMLKSKIEVLRSSLQKMKRYNEETSSRTRDWLQHSSSLFHAIDRALIDEPRPGWSGSPLAETVTMSANETMPPAPAGKATLAPTPPRMTAPSKSQVMLPDTQQLGSNVQPSTSSEEPWEVHGPETVHIPTLEEYRPPQPLNGRSYQAKSDRSYHAQPMAEIPKRPSPSAQSDSPGRNEHTQGEQISRSLAHESSRSRLSDPHKSHTVTPNQAATSQPSPPALPRIIDSPSSSFNGPDQARSQVPVNPANQLRAVKAENGQGLSSPTLFKHHGMETPRGLGPFRQWDDLQKSEAAEAMPPPPRPVA
ncbi:hypothetical protein EJ03DRAFT_330760 [Teratosphaeria nubilosa]|uniref:Uncharacterized protein n=1 Tax=Teratosphaeria nubilosa TaxID=161662 RepID=A0A6G1KZT4_9PEZI|nr:hypothetical protein EJ03DRAFT_330760 [Teratosphaeria nubilosa]